MKTFDYVYRFDPGDPKAPPADSAGARKALEDGNRMFARWMRGCRDGGPAGESGPQYVVRCKGPGVGIDAGPGEVPGQAPFAVVLGCSDARVPAEMIFAQGINDLFVIRVAGNVLGDVGLGSVDFALGALSESVRVLVVLGHSDCGAVTGAVDTYLRPSKFWSRSTSPSLRSILHRVFVPVREAANCLDEVWGPDADQEPGYREALIEIAVALNAAQAAFTLRQEVERAGHDKIEVVFGVYNLASHRVRMPNDPGEGPSDEGVNLASAPSNPQEFHALGLKIAGFLAPKSTPAGGTRAG